MERSAGIPKLLWWYPVLSALAWLTVALPGGWTFDGNSAYVWPALTAVVVGLIARRHYVIWSLVTAAHVCLVIALVALTVPDASIAVVAALNLLAVAVLFAPTVRRFELADSPPGSR